MFIISFKQPQLNNLGASLAFTSPPTTYPKCGQAKNRWRVQIMTKKVIASLAIRTRSGGEPGFVHSIVKDSRLRGRRCPHVTGKCVDICHPDDWLPGGDFPLLQVAMGGWVARIESINRETCDGEAAMKAGTVCAGARWCLVGNVSWWFCLQVFVTGLCKVAVSSPPARSQV